jgi:hypothetical protein
MPELTGHAPVLPKYTGGGSQFLKSYSLSALDYLKSEENWGAKSLR